MTALPRRSTELAPLIGTTYAAQMAEHIYSHLRDRLDWDEDIHDTIGEMMQKSPKEIRGYPSDLNQRAPSWRRPVSQWMGVPSAGGRTESAIGGPPSSSRTRPTPR